MPQRNVASNFTFEQQRVEINNLAQDFWTQKGTVDTAAPTYLKHDGSNDFTGQTLAVPNAFTINSNSGNGTVTISGNLDVTGTTTTVNSANLEVTDKNILIAKGSTSDAQADGAGITIDSATDITFNFVDAKDALVSSIGLEAATFVKATRAQFTGAGNPTTGQGLELTAPDQNTGQIASYDRDNTAYKELRLKGSSVALYGGTSNALVGTFNSTGLDVTGSLAVNSGTINTCATFTSSDAGAVINITDNSARSSIEQHGTDLKIISDTDAGNANSTIKFQVDASTKMTLDSSGNLDVTGNVTATAFSGPLTGDVTGAASKVALGNDSTGASVKRVLFSSADSGDVTIQADTQDGISYKPSDGTLSAQRFEGTIVTAAQASITSVGTLTSLAVNGSNATFQNSGSCELTLTSNPANDSGVYFNNGTNNAGAVTYDHPNNELKFRINSNKAVEINNAGTVLPGADNTQDLGSTTKRWANVYTADAHFNNIGTGGNEVDGSEGHWTMQEGEDDFFLINRRSGKKYKFMLQEVN